MPKKNYIPGSMSFMNGFSGPKGNVGYTMTYDHKKTKKIITDLLNKGKKIKGAIAGLDGDFEVNNSIVFDGKNFQDYTAYEQSIWAEPILLVYFENGHTETYSVWSKND